MCQGKVRAIEVFSRSGSFAKCRGNLKILKNVRALSGNFLKIQGSCQITESIKQHSSTCL